MDISIWSSYFVTTHRHGYLLHLRNGRIMRVAKTAGFRVAARQRVPAVYIEGCSRNQLGLSLYVVLLAHCYSLFVEEIRQHTLRIW